MGLRRRFRANLRLKGRDWLLLLIGAAIALLTVGLLGLVSRSQTPIPYQSAGVTIPWLPATVTKWDDPISRYARQYNIDANLVAIIMTMESGGNSSAKSEDNAIGLLQVTPPTAQDIAAKYLKKPVQHYDLTNPDTNIEFGVAYLAYLRDYFATAQQGPDWTSSVELIAAGYNGGPGAAGNLEAGKGLEDTQTVVYSRDAFNMWRERHVADSPTFDRWKERGGSDLLKAATASQK